MRTALRGYVSLVWGVQIPTGLQLCCTRCNQCGLYTESATSVEQQLNRCGHKPWFFV